jgi:hypothetical protein
MFHLSSTLPGRFLIHDGVVARLTRRLSLVEMELIILPENPCSPLVFNEVRSTRSFIFCVYVFHIVVYPIVLFLFLQILITPLVSWNSSYGF